MGTKYSDSGLSSSSPLAGSEKWGITKSGVSKYVTPDIIWAYFQTLTSNLAAVARVGVRKNSTGSTYNRRRLNLIEGTNVTLTIADDSTDEEIDITIAASGGGGGGGYTQGARVFNNSTQSLSAGSTPFFIDYDSEIFDTDTIHSTVTNTKRLTCKTAGKYAVGGCARIGGATAGTDISIRIRLNGALNIAFDQRTAVGTNDFMAISTVYDFAINDYVELGVTAGAGTSMIVDSQAFYTPIFYMQRIG